MKIKVITLDGGKSSGDVELNEAVFVVPRPPRPASVPRLRAPARSSVARRAAVRLVTAIAALRSSSAAVRRTVSAPAPSVTR
jgi:hypothetical protein